MQRMTRTRLAVLDMAGTTIAVTDAVPAAFTDAFTAAGMDLDNEAISRVRGRSKRQAVRDLIRETRNAEPDDVQVEEVLASFRAHLRARYADGAVPIPGAIPTMRWFRSRNVPVVLATGFDRDLAEFLVARLGWGGDLVTAIVADDDVRQGRPEPDLILRAMEWTATRDPSVVLVAGDTTADLIAASKAGVGTIIGVLSGAHPRARLVDHPHTVLLDSVADIPEWLLSAPGVLAERNRPPGPGLR
jgi:phosphonatase-like hydrolase